MMKKERPETMRVYLSSADGTQTMDLVVKPGDPKSLELIDKMQKKLEERSRSLDRYCPRDRAMAEVWLQKNPWATAGIWFDASCRIREGALISGNFYGGVIDPDSYDELMPECIYRAELYDPAKPFKSWEVSDEMHAKMEALRNYYREKAEKEWEEYWNSRTIESSQQESLPKKKDVVPVKEEIIYNGKKYSRIKGKWVDSNYITVPTSLQSTLDALFEEQRNLDVFTLEELIAEGDRFKGAESYHLAIKYYATVLEETQDVNTYRYVLPRLTSCYRAQGRATEAVGLYERLNQQYGGKLHSPALCTSIAAAYCDIKDYKKATDCADKAYAMSGGKAAGELAAVYGRIRKETTGSGKFE